MSNEAGIMHNTILHRMPQPSQVSETGGSAQELSRRQKANPRSGPCSVSGHAVVDIDHRCVGRSGEYHDLALQDKYYIILPCTIPFTGQPEKVFRFGFALPYTQHCRIGSYPCSGIVSADPAPPGPIQKAGGWMTAPGGGFFDIGFRCGLAQVFIITFFPLNPGNPDKQLT